MNPHFFYNALNTIQSYILSNDKKQAVSYLSKFSLNLIRWLYPPIRNTAPKVDEFINNKIMTSPAPEVTLPKEISVEKIIPKLAIPDVLKTDK